MIGDGSLVIGDGSLVIGDCPLLHLWNNFVKNITKLVPVVYMRYNQKKNVNFRIEVGNDRVRKGEII